jgi:hypothetical protein
LDTTTTTTTRMTMEDVTICKNLLLRALNKAGRHAEVEQLFRTISHPNDYSYTALLEAVSPEQGRDILLLNDHHSTTTTGGGPSFHTAHAYGIVMNKYVQRPNCGPVVEELLEHASRRLPTDALVVLKGIAITAWGNTNTWTAADRATAIYQTVEQEQPSQEEEDTSRPNPVLLTALLQVWSKSTRPDAAHRTVVMFQSMVNQGIASTAAFHLMLSAQTADTAWEMLQAQAQWMGQPPSPWPGGAFRSSRIVVPVAKSWATVLARPGHAVERIYEIVNHYKDSIQKTKQREDDPVFIQAVGAMPTAALAHSFVWTECRSKTTTKKRNYSKVYLVLLKRWSRSRDAVVPERAEEIAGWLAQEEGFEEFVDEVRQILIDIWRRSDRVMAAERIGYLQRQESLLHQIK